MPFSDVTQFSDVFSSVTVAALQTTTTFSRDDERNPAFIQFKNSDLSCKDSNKFIDTAWKNPLSSGSPAATDQTLVSPLPGTSTQNNFLV